MPSERPRGYDLSTRAGLASRFEYTERQMADAFERFVLEKRGLPGIGRVSRLFREVPCQQGRPDFVALMGRKYRFLKGNTVSQKLAGSVVLSFLHEGVGRTPAYLCEHSGLSVRSIKQALGELVRHRYVNCTKTGAYLANPSSSLQTVEVMGIELKLDRPRRAIFQAQQCRAFAQRVLIVVPPSQLRTYRKYQVAIQRWGIGVATFDPGSCEFVLRRKPRSGRPHSKQHQVYAKFQLLEDASRP